MPQPTPAELSLSSARRIDVNTRYQLNGLPDRIPDKVAIIYSSLFNLFNCEVGERGRTFEPTYGTWLRHFLQEPIATTTATAIKLMLMRCIIQWEPGIRVVTLAVIPNFNLPGYMIRITFQIVGDPGNNHDLEFPVSQN